MRNQSRGTASVMFAAVAILWLGQSAIADTSAIERCRQTADAQERIACLEAALDSQAAPAEPQADPADEPRADPAAKKETSQSDVAESGNTPAPESEAPPLPSPASSESVPAESTAPDLGAEQLHRDEEPARATARNLPVKEYSTVWYRRLQVHLDNGQVWRQIEGDTQSVRATLEKNQTVDIERALGGYKLRLNEMRRTIRVRRVQ